MHHWWLDTGFRCFRPQESVAALKLTCHRSDSRLSFGNSRRLSNHSRIFFSLKTILKTWQLKKYDFRSDACISHEKLWINQTQKKHIGRMFTIDFKSVFPPKANSLDQDNRTLRKGSGWGFPRQRRGGSWYPLEFLPLFFDENGSHDTYGTRRYGRGVWQTSCEMDWPCPPSFLLKGDLDFSTLLPDDAAHPVAAIG